MFLLARASFELAPRDLRHRPERQWHNFYGLQALTLKRPLTCTAARGETNNDDERPLASPKEEETGVCARASRGFLRISSRAPAARERELERIRERKRRRAGVGAADPFSSLPWWRPNAETMMQERARYSAATLVRRPSPLFTWCAVDARRASRRHPRCASLWSENVTRARTLLARTCCRTAIKQRGPIIKLLCGWARRR